MIYDVLRDYGIGDLNSDEGMTATLSAIGRITRQGDPQRIPPIVHHALTGESGAARATGFDREGDCGRNSKVLLGVEFVHRSISRPTTRTATKCSSSASGKANNSEDFSLLACVSIPKRNSPL